MARPSTDNLILTGLVPNPDGNITGTWVSPSCECGGDVTGEINVNPARGVIAGTLTFSNPGNTGIGNSMQAQYNVTFLLQGNLIQFINILGNGDYFTATHQ